MGDFSFNILTVIKVPVPETQVIIDPMKEFRFELLIAIEPNVLDINIIFIL